MSDRKWVEVRRDGESCVLTLKREEKLNALSLAVEREIAAALEGAEVRESRAVILTGGERAFSAGADINEMRDADPASILAYYRDIGEVYERFAALPQLTLCAISGYCLGGGFELAMAADFRIADETAVFGLPEVAIGIIPSSGGTQRLVRMIGPARARELMLLRDRLSAREAREYGVVTEVVPKGKSLDRALEHAKRLAELPPLAVEVAKQSVDRAADSPREAGLLIERLAYGMLAQTEDAREAARAFLEKRRPKFTGR